MATLDYAVLAEYARVDPAGLITIVGGSFDRVAVNSAGGGRQLYVALRFLLSADENHVPFEVKVRSPDDIYEIGVAGNASYGPEAQSTDGLFNVLVAVGLGVPLPVPGRYVVQIILAEDIVREVPFVVSIDTTLAVG